MAVNLKKGEKVDLTKSNPGLSSVLVGLGWDVNKFSGGEFDLDASAFILGANDKVRGDSDFIFYNHPKDAASSVEYLGDNRTGEGEGDDEQITVNLSALPADVRKIAFAVTIHEAAERGQNFGQVSNAFIRVVNQADNQELIRYDLSEDYSIETALVIGELYKHQEEWKFAAIGAGFEGGLAALCGNYGVQV